MADNVITLSRHSACQARASSALGNLISSFALHRRSIDDVFWLKENAELLNILECTHTAPSAAELHSYMPFYTSLRERIGFFPQYYRFLVSIALDLEALGLEGEMGECLCEMVRKSGLAEAELSDLQRAEALRLLARRGFAVQGTAELIERLHRFISRPATFAIPNRKAAYELTHIVFYLSEYGRRDPRLSKDATQSLLFTGILAHLEQNADLLAEVCVAMTFAGQRPPQSWSRYVEAGMNAFDRRAYASGAQDDYHEYLVSNWACAMIGKPSFIGSYSAEGLSLYSTQVSLGTMRSLSEHLFSSGAARSGNWARDAKAIVADLSEAQVQHLTEVVGATDHFEAFFELFARPERKPSPVAMGQVT